MSVICCEENQTGLDSTQQTQNSTMTMTGIFSYTGQNEDPVLGHSSSEEASMPPPGSQSPSQPQSSQEPDFPRGTKSSDEAYQEYKNQMFIKYNRRTFAIQRGIIERRNQVCPFPIPLQVSRPCEVKVLVPSRPRWSLKKPWLWRQMEEERKAEVLFLQEEVSFPFSSSRNVSVEEIRSDHEELMDSDSTDDWISDLDFSTDE